MSCPECGGHVVPFTGGTWTETEIGETRTRSLRCVACSTIITVEQKITDMSIHGNVNDIYD
jgi:DNA-directed RNA polymerase subunit RPC12/RpoP